MCKTKLKMSREANIINHIVKWLKDYAKKVKVKGYIIGVSGGIDSSVVSTLCAKTGLITECIEMPIDSQRNELSVKHIKSLMRQYPNVRAFTQYLTGFYKGFLDMKFKHPNKELQELALANVQSRLRMITLYYYAQVSSLLVCGTGNKVEDYGIGFFTKYGDGGVDVSPIGNLLKSEVYAIGKELGINEKILAAKPTDGLWEDGRTDEEQIGATYDEIEWAMEFTENHKGDKVQLSRDYEKLNERQKQVWSIYNKFHNRNRHKTLPIPICKIPF